MLTYSLRFDTYLGNQGDVPLGASSASVSIKETFEVRFEPVSSTASNVKVLPSER